MNEIQAFVDSVIHKFAAESGATHHVTPEFTRLTYPFDLEHPWPRVFKYRIECFTSYADAQQVVACLRQFLGPDPVEHVLNVISGENAGLDENFAAAGYQKAWVNTLMKRPLSAQDVSGHDTQATVRPLASPADVIATNSLAPDYPSHVAAIDDPHLHEYVIEYSGKIVGKAQMVTINAHIAYVSDMFVHPSQRGKGLGKDLLQHLHSQALAFGKKQMILVPSLMTRQIHFYERYGYRDGIPMHLFIPLTSQSGGQKL